MLKVEALETSYGNSQALFGVNLEIQAGQVATLMGRNGMGKTTTINSIMGVVKPKAGSIKFEGKEIVGQPEGHHPKHDGQPHHHEHAEDALRDGEVHYFNAP